MLFARLSTCWVADHSRQSGRAVHVGWSRASQTAATRWCLWSPFLWWVRCWSCSPGSFWRWRFHAAQRWGCRRPSLRCKCPTSVCATPFSVHLTFDTLLISSPWISCQQFYLHKSNHLSNLFSCCLLAISRSKQMLLYLKLFCLKYLYVYLYNWELIT